MLFIHIHHFVWAGTLDGFLFDSEDEADKMPKAISNQNDQGIEGQTNGKIKGKAEKKSVCSQPSSFIEHLKLIKLHCFCLNKFPTFFFPIKKKVTWWCIYAYLREICMQGVVRKRGKTAGGKPQAPKRVRKKNQVSKKGKTKKWETNTFCILHTWHKI